MNNHWGNSVKTSQYEIILPLTGQDGKPVSGKKLLVNGLYKSFDVAEAETAEKLLASKPFRRIRNLLPM